ncbi:MAG TPA: hypothetical protein VFW87_09045 [Pirellulales bacterium]|nr:hypothetical protein [Pirellulales bacterium]
MEFLVIRFDDRYTRRMAAKVQFSLRTIFVVTAVAAVVVAEAVAFPGWLADIMGVGITFLLPPAFVAQIVYARRGGRAFGIGACSVWLAVGWMDRVFGISVDGNRIGFSIVWSLILVGGGVAVLVRWYSISK